MLFPHYDIVRSRSRSAGSRTGGGHCCPTLATAFLARNGIGFRGQAAQRENHKKGRFATAL
jgi:hypothetical protein